MSVTIPLSWERRKLWGNAAAEVTGVVAPTQNSFICASLGVSSVAWDCGTVATTSTTWTSSTCGCQQSGARHTGIATIDGDSGSPIIYSTGGSFKAVGVHDTAGGNFAKMSAIFSDWPGWTVYAP
jgi:hypothetical protein